MIDGVGIVYLSATMIILAGTGDPSCGENPNEIYTKSFNINISPLTDPSPLSGIALMNSPPTFSTFCDMEYWACKHGIKYNTPDRQLILSLGTRHYDLTHYVYPDNSWARVVEYRYPEAYQLLLKLTSQSNRIQGMLDVLTVELVKCHNKAVTETLEEIDRNHGLPKEVKKMYEQLKRQFTDEISKRVCWELYAG